jgi:hypothetical protein
MMKFGLDFGAEPLALIIGSAGARDTKFLRVNM